MTIHVLNHTDNTLTSDPETVATELVLRGLERTIAPHTSDHEPRVLIAPDADDPESILFLNPEQALAVGRRLIALAEEAKTHDWRPNDLRGWRPTPARPLPIRVVGAP